MAKFKSQIASGRELEACLIRCFAAHFLMLPDEEASSEQIEVFRRMTPEQRWQAAQQLYWTMRRHKAAFIHSQHPEWPEQRIEDEVRRIFSHART